MKLAKKYAKDQVKYSKQLVMFIYGHAKPHFECY